jgi:hypothetical protein
VISNPSELSSAHNQPLPECYPLAQDPATESTDLHGHHVTTIPHTKSTRQTSVEEANRSNRGRERKGRSARARTLTSKKLEPAEPRRTSSAATALQPFGEFVPASPFLSPPVQPTVARAADSCPGRSTHFTSPLGSYPKCLCRLPSLLV